jgi:hypothetical protein
MVLKGPVTGQSDSYSAVPDLHSCTGHSLSSTPENTALVRASDSSLIRSHCSGLLSSASVYPVLPCSSYFYTFKMEATHH